MDRARRFSKFADGARRGLLALAVGGTSAAAATTSSAPSSSTAAAPRLLKARPPYWLRLYSTTPRQVYWTGELTVKRLDDDLPRVLVAVDKEGGSLTQDLRSFVSGSNPPTQQLTLVVPRARANSLIKRLRKLGQLPEPAAREAGENIPFDEVKTKIDRLVAERAQRAAELSRMPVAEEIEEELLGYLLTVKALAPRGEEKIRIDLLVRQK